MYISLDMNQYNEKNIMISEKTKNNIMSQGDFYRLYFSTPELTLNGIHITFEVKNITIEKYFNKIKCLFEDNLFNNTVVENIKNIESSLLKKFNYINSNSVHRVEEQLRHKYIKMFDENLINIGSYSSIKFVLKISGIWSSSDQYGLTFRFFLTPIIH
jgi:hypothetical protein